jgi:hypothetical protein
MSNMGAGTASSLRLGDSFTRLIIMPLMDADARATAHLNAIADLDATQPGKL